VFRRPVDDEKFGDDISRMNTPNSRFVMNFQLFIVAPHPPLPQMHIVSGILFCTIHPIIGTVLDRLYMNPGALVSRPSCVPTRASELICPDEVRGVLKKYEEQNLRSPDDLERVLADGPSQPECVRAYMLDFFWSGVFISLPVLRELIAINNASPSRIDDFRLYWSRSALLRATTDMCRMHSWYFWAMHELMSSAHPTLGIEGQVITPPTSVIDQLIAAEIDTLTKMQAGRKKRVRTDEPNETVRRPFRTEEQVEATVRNPLQTTENSREQADAADRILLQTIRRESFTDDMVFLKAMMDLLDFRLSGVATATMRSYLTRVQRNWSRPIGVLMGDARGTDYYAQNFREPLLTATASGISHATAMAALYVSDGTTVSFSGDMIRRWKKVEKHRIVALSGIVPLPTPMSSSSSSVQVQPPSPALRIKFPLVCKPDVVVNRFLLTLIQRVTKMRSVAEFTAFDLPGMIAATSFPGVVYPMSAKIWAEDILRCFAVSREDLHVMITHQNEPLSNMAFHRLLDNHTFAQASLNWYVAFAGQYQQQPLEKIPFAPNMQDRILPPIDAIQRIAYDLIIELSDPEDEDSVPG
jgi:hypothetical protein